jgi:hypothetical protein
MCRPALGVGREEGGSVIKTLFGVPVVWAENVSKLQKGSIVFGPPEWAGMSQERAEALIDATFRVDGEELAKGEILQKHPGVSVKAPPNRTRKLLIAVRQALIMVLGALEDYLELNRSITPKHKR